LLLGSGVSQLDDLPGELGGVADALVPAPVQVLVIAVQDVGTLLILGDQAVNRRGASELADRRGMQIQFPGDGGLGEAPCRAPSA
jgi:hypothetical protein